MLRILSLGIAFHVVFALSAAALSQQLTYLDDRTTPRSLVASYYNALNSNEYARAWSYWDNQMEGTNFEDFVEGFTGIDRYEFKIGETLTEGAAGSIFTQIPLVVLTHDEDGWNEVYRGCFVSRIANPRIQSPPFLGLHFWEGYLVPVDTSFKETTPGICE